MILLGFRLNRSLYRRSGKELCGGSGGANKGQLTGDSTLVAELASVKAVPATDLMTHWIPIGATLRGVSDRILCSFMEMSLTIIQCTCRGRSIKKARARLNSIGATMYSLDVLQLQIDPPAGDMNRFYSLSQPEKTQPEKTTYEATAEVVTSGGHVKVEEIPLK